MRSVTYGQLITKTTAIIRMNCIIREICNLNNEIIAPSTLEVFSYTSYGDEKRTTDWRQSHKNKSGRALVLL